MKKSAERKNKKSKEEEKKNPLHREYGVWSNLKFTVRNIRAYEPFLLILVPIGIVIAPVMQYLRTFLTKFVIDMVTGETEVDTMLGTVLLFSVIQLITTMANSYFYSENWWRYISTRFHMMTDKNIKVMTVRFEYLENPDVMDCYQKALNACDGNMNGIEGMMRQIESLLKTLSIVIVGILIIGTLSPWTMLVVLVLSAINFAISNYTNKKCKRTVWDPLMTWWRKNYYMANMTTDFKAAKDIRIFGLRKWLLDKIRVLKEERLQAQKTAELAWWYASLANNLITLVGQGMLYAWLIYCVIHGSLTIGNFSLYLASAATLFTNMSGLLSAVSEMFARSREVDDFRSFLDFDKEEAKTEEGKGKRIPTYETYEFTFKNVSFHYPKAEKYALKNLNLTLAAGERLAVVGLNGAGKSTFIKLLLRLYEPTEGEILLNGVNIKEYDKRYYYELFAPVFQDIQLFAFPLAENVSMKTPEETNETKAEESLIRAGLGEKLKELSQGIHTELLKVISDDGVDLSGGEKQKLALARALYKDAPIVVLDEPTAALDALAEYKLYQDFDKLIGSKTAVYISHRLSSTQFCNHVAMFMNGEMVEYGTHESLLREDGEYAKMFHVQAQYYVEEENNTESVVAANV